MGLGIAGLSLSLTLWVTSLLSFSTVHGQRYRRLAAGGVCVVDEVVTFLDADYEVALLRPEDPAAQAFINKLGKTGRTAIRVLELDDS